MTDQPEKLQGLGPPQMPEDPDLWYENRVTPEMFEICKPKLGDPKVGTIMVYRTGREQPNFDWNEFYKIFNYSEHETTIQTSKIISGQQKEIDPDKFDY